MLTATGTISRAFITARGFLSLSLTACQQHTAVITGVPRQPRKLLHHLHQEHAGAESTPRVWVGRSWPSSGKLATCSEFS